MEKVVERVVRTYGMMVDLTAEEEKEARERVLKFVEGRSGDENPLTVEAMIRGQKPYRSRRAG